MSAEDSRCDIAVIGAGIVGLATAMALSGRGLRVTVLEAERAIASHQTGHNSGVVHSGLYYRPGSERARLCVEGRAALELFCAAHGVSYERCGKLVVATHERELPRLEELERRGRANGLSGVRRLSRAEMREREPHAAGVAALHVPETGIADFGALAAAYADRVRERGGEVLTGAGLTACRRVEGGLALETARGAVRCRALVACAGLQADRVARRCGVDPGARIVPFRGEYRELKPARRHLVRTLIYPVPDPRLPFLGVHLTRRVDGRVEAGPNAVLALARHGYSRWGVAPRDLTDMLAWPGFWRMSLAHWRSGAGELARSAASGAFLRALQRLVPDLRSDDFEGEGSGVRAQALGRDGALLDDFHVVEGERMLHVINAPSPAATASIAIGRWVAERVVARLGT